MTATAVSNAHAAHISKFIFNHFPSNIKRFHDSIAFKSISTLAHTFQNITFPPGEKPDGLDDHLHHAKVALIVLDELRDLPQGDLPYCNTKARKVTAQRPGPGSSEPSVDVQRSIKCFEALGLRIPKTPRAAEETIQKILETQRRVLKVRSLLLPAPVSQKY